MSERSVWVGRGLTGLKTGLFLGVVSVANLWLWLETAPVPVLDASVQDVTELIHVDVERIARPTSTEELQALLERYDGPVSIGGGRFSMGGQIATDDTLFLDLQGFNEVLALDVEAKTVKVEAGISWRTLIEALDPHDLSVKIMQSYANFTVGGTLSVNAHGRYTGLGPVVHSVRSLDLVLADGRRVHCSRTENRDLFFGAIGGYGGLGVIATVELDVTDNIKLQRTVERMPVADFMPYFDGQVRTDADAVMFNADLYPPDYDELVSIVYKRTDEPLTLDGRLQDGGTSSQTDRLMYWWVSEGPLGKQTRSEVIDRMRLSKKQVLRRNFEATYDVAGLDPGSRANSTYVLQEYFIPVERHETFAPKMAKIFQDHDVNVVNVSIRHAIADPDTLLSWAPSECFAYVIYYKMGTSEEAWEATREWTRAMSEAIIEENGVWYLPYQIHATPEQFRRAYPRADEFFALKKRVDPTYTFRNRLWDRYLPPDGSYGATFGDEAAIRDRLAMRDSWHRAPDQTFLTVPEWSVVYSADEAGAFLKHHRPSEYPWFGSIAQFWQTYRAVWAISRDRYEFNTGYHVMIGVIGASYTVEFAAKGAYENTVGRVFEWVGGERVAAEDHYAQVTTDYGAFTHHTPWYAFPFAERRGELASLPSTGGTLRQWERGLASRVEFTLKSWWASCIAGATGAAYDPEAETVEVWLRPRGMDVTAIPGVSVLEDLGDGNLLAAVPRYEPFTAAAMALARGGAELVEVAGGTTIVVQVQVASGTDLGFWGDTVFRNPLLTDESRERVALEVPIRRLDEVLPALLDAGHIVEHLYDF